MGDPLDYVQPCDWAILMNFRGRSFSVVLTRLSSVTRRDAQAALSNCLANTQNLAIGGGSAAEIKANSSW